MVSEKLRHIVIELVQILERHPHEKSITLRTAWLSQLRNNLAAINEQVDVMEETGRLPHDWR